MGFTDLDTVFRGVVGQVPTAAWFDTVNDDLNYLFAGGAPVFSGTASLSYVTGGVTINLGRTFTSAPFPVVSLGDATGPTSCLAVAAATTTTSMQVMCFTGGSETAAGVDVRINWIVQGNV